MFVCIFIFVCVSYLITCLQVIDPEMPSEGLRVNGEFIQAPSDDVLEHKDKNPQNTILVRFFDGRRSW